ncbi:MAG: 2-oxoacid:acceptor oxidoreductase subunit alpha [Nitrososphaerota archaeon]|nr:2-oxoacid:acceptor oxidoreductase subunit alpha [Nitrososphaerota archaeon]
MESKNSDISWMIGGAQGSGVDSSATIFARACVLGGLWVFGTREYYSNIKGLHSYFEVRVSDHPVRSMVDHTDVLATFDAETLIRHAEVVRPGGAIVYNPVYAHTQIEKVDTIEHEIRQKISARLAQQNFSQDANGILEEAKKRNIRLFPISYEDITSKVAKQIGETQLSRLSRIVNVLAVSASFAILGFDETYLEQAIQRTFGERKKIVDMNVAGAKIAYDLVSDSVKGSYPIKLSATRNEPRLLLMGNQAVALGKLAAGCRLQTYYPITPASDESEFLESHELFDVVDSKSKGSILVMQTEDEIAAITMAIGAALTGTRAATSTSGPGFSLMVEGMGWAGMNEVPVVITLYSRGGPSTGLPTRNEAGDLRFALGAGHGDFPRIVICSGDMEEAFYDEIRAFNYAEKYQLPVIHMLDKAMANSTISIPPLGSKPVPIERGKLISSGEYVPKNPSDRYKRFAFSEDGISPRAVLGLKGYTFWNTGDEHLEIGHISEDPENRVKMMTKRMSKLETAASEIPDKEKYNFFPAKKSKADVTIVSWGSSKGVILDAMELLERDGISPEFLQIRLASPFPTEFVKKKLQDAKLVVDIEQNYTAQMEQVIRQNTLLEIKHKILKFNGRPITQDEIYDSIKRVVGKSSESQRLVLVHGA